MYDTIIISQHNWHVNKDDRFHIQSICKVILNKPWLFITLYTRPVV